MGLLRLGVPLSWEECKGQADHVRYHGVQQFLNIWRQLKDRQGDGLLWGDEVSHSNMSACFKRARELIMNSDRVYGGVFGRQDQECSFVLETVRDPRST